VTLVGSRRVDSKKFPLAAAAGEHTFADFDKHFDQGLGSSSKDFRQAGGAKPCALD